MNPVAATFVLLGAAVSLLAAIGMLRFRTPYARFHAAGKATPIAFLLVTIGAAVELPASAIPMLFVAAGAMVLTLPVSVHLLFRAIHRTGDNHHLRSDALSRPERVARSASTDTTSTRGTTP